MQLLLPLLLAAASLSAQPPASNDEIIASESAFWKAYVDGSTDELSKLLAPDFTSVEQYIWSRDQVLDFVKKFHAQCTLAPVKPLDIKVTFLTPDIATTVYHATEAPTCGTNSLSGNTNISTVWIRKDGRWQMHLHTEYAIPPK